jgi:hypothetical protein
MNEGKKIKDHFESTFGEKKKKNSFFIEIEQMLC